MEAMIHSFGCRGAGVSGRGARCDQISEMTGTDRRTWPAGMMASVTDRASTLCPRPLALIRNSFFTTKVTKSAKKTAE
jgi:hypothetical protein